MFKLIDGTELTEEIKDAFKKKVTKAYIKLKDGTILSGENFLKSLEIEDLRYNEETNNFLGEAVAKRATVDLYNKDNAINVEDEEFEAFIGAELSDGTTAWISYGNFIVQKPENDDTKEDTVIEAFDYMCKFNKTYTPGVTFPCTYADIVEDICEQCGVELANRDFRNAEKVVKENFFINGEQCRTVLKQVAKIAFSWARVGNDNKLYIDFKNKDIEETFENFDLDSYIDLNKNNQLIPVDTIVLRNSAIESENVTIKFDKDAKINKFIGDMEQDTIEAVAGTTVENSSVHVTDVDVDFETEVLPMGAINQDTIAEVVGTTVEGSSIHATGVDLNYETKVLPMGAIEQDTSTTGNNILDVNALTKGFINADTGVITTNSGYPDASYTGLIKLKAGDYLRTKDFGIEDGVDYVRIRLYNADGTYNSNVTQRNYQASEDCMVRVLFLKTVVQPMITINYVINEYEEFVLNELSTNNPIPVKGVGTIYNRNICLTNPNAWEYGHYDSAGGIKQEYNSRIRLIDLLPVNPSTAYYFNTFNSSYNFVVRQYDKNKVFVGSTGGVPNNSAITTRADAEYLGISIYSPANVATTFEDYLTLLENGSLKLFICLNSETNKTYVEHKDYCRYETVVGNKNLLPNVATTTTTHNGITQTVYEDGSINYKGTSTGTATFDIMPKRKNFLKVGTKYALSTKNNVPAKVYFRLLDGDNTSVYYEVQNTNKSGFTYNGKFTSDTIRSFVYFGTAQVGGTYDFTIYPMLEEGDTNATDYIQHQEQTLPIDIPAGQEWYSGKPYKFNDKWYRPIEWEKEKITSTHTIEKGMYGTNAYAIVISKECFNNGETINVLSNHFKGVACADRALDIKDMIYAETSKNTKVTIRNTSFTTVEEVKAFLDSNDVYVVYKLASPTREEITDSHLIEQLENIQSAELYEGVTNLKTYATVDEAADMPLSIKYNFVTPSPSLDIPSDAKGVGSEKFINHLDMTSYIETNVVVSNSTNTSIDVETTDITKAAMIYFFAPNLKSGVTYRTSMFTEVLSGAVSSSRIELYKTDKTWIKSIGAYNNISKESSGTFTVDTDGDYLVRYLLCETGKLTQNIKLRISNAMVYDYTKGVIIPFTPYGYCRYENKIYGQNYFNIRDKFNSSNNFPSEVTVDNDDWVTITVDNTNGTGIKYVNFTTNTSNTLKENTDYNIVFETKSVNASGNSYIYIISNYSAGNSESQFVGNLNYALSGLAANTKKVITRTTQSDFSILKTPTMMRGYLQCPAGQTATITFRISVVETSITSQNFVYRAFKEQSLPIDIIQNYAVKYETIMETTNVDANSKVVTATDFKLLFFKVPKGKYHISLKSGKTATWVISDWATIPTIGTVINPRVVQNSQKEFDYEVKQNGYLILRYGLSLNWDTVREFINDLIITKDTSIWYSGKPYKVGSKWYRPVEFEKYVFTGNEIFNKSSTYANDTYFCGYLASSITKFKDSNVSTANQGASNMFKAGLYSKVLDEECMSWGTQMHVRILASRLSENSSAGLQAFFKELYDNGTPVYVIAPLQTPYAEEITDTHLIAQLEAIKAAELYEGITNVNSYKTSDDVAEMPLSVRYNFVTPAPSIDRESPINKVTGECKLYRYNRNILDLRDARVKGTNAGITLTQNEDYSYHYEGTATSTAINVWLKGDYRTWNNYNDWETFDKSKILFTLLPNVRYEITDVAIFLIRENGQKATLSPHFGEKVYITPIDKLYAVAVRAPQCIIGTTYDTTIYPMVTIGETDKYIQHSSQTFPLNLGSLELLDNEYIYWKNNKWYKHKLIDKYNSDLDKEGWTIEANSGVGYIRFRKTVPNATSEQIREPIISNRFVSTLDGKHPIGGAFAWGYQIFIYPPKEITTADLLQEWFVSNPTIIYYYTKTPIEEEITDTTLLSQLNAIKDEFFLVEGENHIMFSCDNGTQPQLEIKHYPNKYSLKETISTGNDLTLNASYEHRELVVKEDYFAYNEETRRDLIESARELFGLTYLPIDLSGIGTAYLENNDLVTVTDKMGNVRPTYCLNHILKYNGVLYDTIAAPAMTETETKYQNESQEDLSRRRTEVIVNKATQEIQLVSEKVDTYDSRISEVEVGLDGIISKIESDIDITRTVNGLKTLTLEECLEGDLLELHIYGNNQVFKRITPSGTTYPSDELIVKDDSLIKITRKEIDEEGNYIGETSEIIDLKIKEGLRQLGDVADSFDLVNNKATLTRRIGVNTDDSLYVLTNPIVEDLGDLEIPLVRGTNIIEIVNYSAMMSAKYVIINAFTNTFATTVDLKSAIEILYNQINLEVSKKVNDDEIIARINMAILGRNEVEIPEDINKSIIEILANKISIKSDNFELSNDGTVTAKEGNIAGFKMLKPTNSTAWLVYDNEDDGEKYRSGFYQSNGYRNFLFAGLTSFNEEGTEFNFADVPFEVTSNGVVTARYIHLNGESGFANVRFDSGKIAMSLTARYLDFRLDNNDNALFARFIRETDGFNLNLQNAPKFRINDTLHGRNLYTADANNGNRPQHYFVGQMWKDYDTTGTYYAVVTEQTCSCSDKRLKDNVVDSETSGLDRVNRMNFRQFDWNKQSPTPDVHVDIGIIAQELKEIDENYVGEFTRLYNGEEQKLYNINDLNLITTGLKAIQELSAENNKLKETVDKQQKIIDFLINKLDCKDEILEILKEGE